MDKIREKIIDFMEHNPVTSKLKGDKWYTMEDALVNLFCKMTGATDKTYENQTADYPTLLDQRLAETDYNEFEHQIYKKVDRHFQYKDLEAYLNEQNYIPQDEILLYKNKADIIIKKYDDYAEYDWRNSMSDAVSFVKYMEDK